METESNKLHYIYYGALGLFFGAFVGASTFGMYNYVDTAFSGRANMAPPSVLGASDQRIPEPPTAEESSEFTEVYSSNYSIMVNSQVYDKVYTAAIELMPLVETKSTYQIVKVENTSAMQKHYEVTFTVDPKISKQIQLEGLTNEFNNILEIDKDGVAKYDLYLEPGMSYDLGFSIKPAKAYKSVDPLVLNFSVVNIETSEIE